MDTEKSYSKDFITVIACFQCEMFSVFGWNMLAALVFLCQEAIFVYWQNEELSMYMLLVTWQLQGQLARDI